MNTNTEIVCIALENFLHQDYFQCEDKDESLLSRLMNDDLDIKEEVQCLKDLDVIECELVDINYEWLSAKMKEIFSYIFNENDNEEEE